MAPEDRHARDLGLVQVRVVVQDADDAGDAGGEHFAREAARADEQKSVRHDGRSACSRSTAMTRSWSASVSAWKTGRIRVRSFSRSVTGSPASGVRSR